MSPLNGGFEYRERLGTAAAGLALLDYLSERYRHSTREEWRARIRAGRVLIQGKPAALQVVLSPGQLLTWRRPPWQEQEVPLQFAILYIDDHLVAVAKPSGLPTVPGGDFLENTLLWRIKQRFPEADPLHRLGRGTSGLVLFARTGAARRNLSADWREGRVVKIYRALVSGFPEHDEFTVDVPIGPVRHEVLGAVYAACPRGKPARSRARVLERRAADSLVEIAIETGRPHQIRIHMAAAGHPLTGDLLYSGGGIPIDGTRALPGDGGYLLHSARLEFAHPAGGQKIEINCPPPPLLRMGQYRGR